MNVVTNGSELFSMKRKFLQEIKKNPVIRHKVSKNFYYIPNINDYFLNKKSGNETEIYANVKNKGIFVGMVKSAYPQGK